MAARSLRLPALSCAHDLSQTISNQVLSICLLLTLAPLIYISREIVFVDPLPTHYTASAKSSAGYDDITKLFNGLLSHLKCKSPGARASLQASQRITVLDALGCL